MKLFSFILQRKIILIALITLTITVGITVVIFYVGRLSFDLEDVSLEIIAPENIAAGEHLKFTIIYKNRTKVTLKNVQLTFHQPKYFEEESAEFKQWDIGNIAPSTEGTVEVRGRVFGALNSVKHTRVRLNFWPTGFNSPFEKWSSTDIIITSSPLVVDLEAPRELTSGQQIEYSLAWENESDNAFQNIEIRIQYPDGFEFFTASPSPDQENHIWRFSEIPSRAKGQITITGTLSGDLEEHKIVRAELGSLWDHQFVKYLELTASAQISTFPLIISQSINDESHYNANWAELLKIKIRYKNTADVGAKEAIIKCELGGEALDLSTLKIGRGFFDGTTKTITWSAAANPELRELLAGEEGEINFSVKIKESPPVSKFKDKNFAINFKSLIDSPTVPIPPGEERLVGVDKFEIKVNSGLTLTAKGFYQEEMVDIVNFGPIPPRVGDTTTYTIHWYLINLTNDLEGVVVEADIPDGVEWTGKFLPAEAFLKYNERTGRLIWDIKKLSANTGTLLPVKKVVFQVSITPSLPQVDQEVILVVNPQARAVDSFTGVDLSSVVESISTLLPDDPNIGAGGGIVVDKL